MKILVCGNMGYLGSVLIPHLRQRFPSARLEGLDSGFFAHCLTGASRLPESMLDAQHFGDVREIPEKILDGVDAVVQLAAISNDPMGQRFASVTHAINCASSLALAQKAARAGVRNFVFASSCSVYGSAAATARKEEDPLDPLTAYARSKVETEQGIAAADLGAMTTTCLRFATACGMSDRLRLDLVLNDFVASALVEKKITVLSDGTPWRPLIHVRDMARAIAWALARPATCGGQKLIVNAGAQHWNHQVRALAEAVAQRIGNVEVSINQAAPPDRRSYQVDFARFAALAPDAQPQETLESAIDDLREGLTRMCFRDPAFRSSESIRLKVLEAHIAAGALDEDLRWRC